MNVLPCNDAKQGLMIMQSLQVSLSKMLNVNELTNAIRIRLYNKAYILSKYLKCSFLTGKNGLPVVINDPPKGTVYLPRRT